MLAEPNTKKRGSLMPSWGFVPAGQDQALKRLAKAIIGQASVDAMKDDQNARDARCWLLSEDCIVMCDFVEVNHRAIRAWVNAGCPDNRNRTTNQQERK